MYFSKNLKKRIRHARKFFFFFFLSAFKILIITQYRVSNNNNENKNYNFFIARFERIERKKQTNKKWDLIMRARF